jgi:hypothetical protein
MTLWEIERKNMARRPKRSSAGKGWKKVHGRWVKKAARKSTRRRTSHRDLGYSSYGRDPGKKRSKHKKSKKASKSRKHGSVHVHGYHVAGYSRKAPRRRR